MLKTAVFTLLILILLMYPSVAVAQPPTCGFYGNAAIEGDDVPNGTAIKAWIDGKVVASTTTPCQLQNCSYDYTIKIIEGDSDVFTGKTIVFTVGSLDLQAGTAKWTAGGNSRLNLDGMESISIQELPPPSITLMPTEGVVTRIEGKGYNPGSVVTVTVGGIQAGQTQAKVNGGFEIVIAAPNQEAGTYDVVVTDAGGTTRQATLIVPDLRGEDGVDGEPGDDGMTGPKGDTGGTTLAVVALVLSSIAVIASVLVIVRFADFLKKNRA